MKSLKKNFLEYCLKNKLKVNKSQIEVIDLLNIFYDNSLKKKKISNFFKKKKRNIRILFIWRCWCRENYALKFLL